MIYKFNLWFLKLHTHMAINLNQGWKLLTWFVIVEGNLLIDMEMNQLNHIHFIVVTYFQFDSNIRVLYVFLGFLKNTWKYLIQRPIFKPLYNYNVFFKNTWKYFSLSTFEKYSYFVCHYYDPLNLHILIYVKFEIKWCAKYQTTMFNSTLKARKNIVNRFKLYLQNNEQCQPIIMTLKTQLHNDQIIYIVRNQITNHRLPSQLMWDCYIINAHLLSQKKNQQLII